MMFYWTDASIVEGIRLYHLLFCFASIGLAVDYILHLVKQNKDQKKAKEHLPGHQADVVIAVVTLLLMLASTILYIIFLASSEYSKSFLVSSGYSKSFHFTIGEIEMLTAMSICIVAGRKRLVEEDPFFPFVLFIASGWFMSASSIFAYAAGLTWRQ